MRELDLEPVRTRGMKRLLNPLVFMFLSVFALAACGSTSEVGTASGDAEGNGVPVEDVVEEPAEDSDEGAVDESEGDEPLPVEADGDIGDDAEPLPLIDPAEEQVITNDVMVSPALVTPTELVLNPEDDTELWVRFIGGDPNCTAASAILLTETPDLVEVELQVGITEDALSRSCVADEFALRVELQLSESATGKTLGALQAADAEPPLVTPDVSTDEFIGLTEAEAAELADESGLVWRTVRVDGESFAVTQDLVPSRLNFEIDEGVITAVTLG